ncbi:MAG: LamG-like jellyroll fold domain-containing protein, partial [Candidatus Magasanikbacteria bacterium]|nr:LamG-like jellyroll fold domain-containing protein [Candidatus Magasanikbacteria bacterium]
GSVDLSTGVTIGAWVKTNNTASEKARVLWLGNYIDSRIQEPSNIIGLSVQNGRVRLDLRQNKSWERELVSNIIINDNNWHFLTAVFDTTKQQMLLYVDGQEQSQVSFELPLPLFEMLGVGMTEARFDYEQINFLGVVDDVWLRQEALSGEKINNIFQSGQAYKFDAQNYDLAPPSVFVNYDFDHINGTVALDSSANNYDIFWGYNMYSPTASSTPRLVPGKFDQGVNFKKDWETYSRKFDPIKNFSQGFSSGIWIKTSEANELPARIFWIGEEPEGRMDEVAYSDYLAVTEVAGKIKVDLNFYDSYFQDGKIMFKRQYSLNSKTFISDDTWHHVAVTLDSRPNVHEMKLYIDGKLEDTSFFPSIIPPVDKLALGHREYTACGTQYNFNGTEDDLFIMNSVISDEDVKDIYESNSAFTWPIRKRNPVIIVPGIMGSWTTDDGWKLDPILHTYDDLWGAFKSAGYEENKNLFAFPYQWRFSNSYTASLLKNKIDQVKNICHCNKVDLVAHSMGGLVARYYIVSDYYENDVDKLVFLGTPHKGSPKSYLMWEAGEGFVDLKEKIVKYYFNFESHFRGYKNIFSYIQNEVKSVEQLLPDYSYIKDKN